MDDYLNRTFVKWTCCHIGGVRKIIIPQQRWLLWRQISGLGPSLVNMSKIHQGSMHSTLDSTRPGMYTWSICSNCSFRSQPFFYRAPFSNAAVTHVDPFRFRDTAATQTCTSSPLVPTSSKFPTDGNHAIDKSWPRHRLFRSRPPDKNATSTAVASCYSWVDDQCCW